MRLNNNLRLRGFGAFALAALALLCWTGMPPVEAQSMPVFNQTALNESELIASYAPYFTAYDTFTLNATYQLTNLQWVGEDGDDGQAAMKSFSVNFYSDDNGEPGAVIASDAITQYKTYDSGHRGDDDGDNYLPGYSAQLVTPLTLAAHKKYWISIQANPVDPRTNWYWDQADGPGDAYFANLDGLYPLDISLAFTLYGVYGGPANTLARFTIYGASIAGGAHSTGTVTLTSPAPSAGATVALSSDTPAATVPASVTIPAGATSATFRVNTKSVAVDTPAKIKAIYNASSLTANVTVAPVYFKRIALASTSIQGGLTTTENRVYLHGNAYADTTISLGSNSPLASLPSDVIIKAGSSSHLFTITTQPVTTPQFIAIGAAYNGIDESIGLTITPAPGILKSVAVESGSVQGGTTLSSNRVYIYGDAPADTTVKFTSSDTSLATVQSQVILHQGYSSHIFKIVTKPVRKVQGVAITAYSEGISRTVTLDVTP